MRNVLATVMCTCLVGILVAQPEHCPTKAKAKPGTAKHPIRIEFLLRKGKEKIGLTDKQVEQIKAMHTELQKVQVKTRADIEVLEIDLGQAMQEDKISKPKVDALCDKIANLRNQMQKDRLHVMIDVLNMLTKKQKEKLKDLRMEHRKHGKTKAKK